MNRIKATLVTALAVLAVPLALTGFVPSASAHVDPPTVTALHAIVADPLFAPGAPGGTLFGIKPDEQTAMASTTKIWALDVTAQALALGKVHLDDKVTINAYEASVGGSSMVDVLGTPLEQGEVVKLGDLIRGMMYPSGNNATYAIVAQAYYGPNGTWQDFVAMMNAKAAALGQTHSHFENPNGWDGPNHYTTARELAAEFQHVLQDPFSAQVESFKGTYTATTQGPKGPKTYMFNRASSYPGWEGEKNGITTNCNGPAAGCIVRAATRIGRRVVVATMQGTRGAEENGMLDYGFAQIFHPDPRGTSVAWGKPSRTALDCSGTGNVLTAVLPPSGPVSLVRWQAKVDGSTVGKLQEETLPGSGYSGRTSSADVALTHLPTGDIILGTRMGPNVQLSRWTTARDGKLMLLASGIAAGTATSVGLQPVSGDTFLTAVTTPTGRLVLKSWRLQGSGLVNLDTYTSSDFWNTYKEVSIAGPVTADVFSGHRAVTVALEGTHTWIHTWGVDQATGKISQLGENVRPFAVSGVTISPFYVNEAFAGELFPPPYYAVAFHNDENELQIDFYRVDGTGVPVFESTTWSSDADVPGNWMRLAPLGTGGLMSETLDASGNIKLIAWDAHRGADNNITATTISEHTAPAGTSIDLCRLPSSTHAEGDYVTGTRDLDGYLRVRAYRSGDRPY
jgi:D-alanyl-D-alanine carboxypeptidase